MPRGFGSISSITLPEGGGKLRVGNSRQGDEAATHRLLVGVPVPGDAIERLDYLRAGLIRWQGLRPCLRRERNQGKDQAEARPRPAGESPAVTLQPRGF